MINEKIRLLLLCFTTLALQACSSEESLEEWMLREQSNAKGTIAPLPLLTAEIEEPRIAFDLNGLDPFNYLRLKQVSNAGSVDMSRPKQYLEQFGLDQLAMVGSVIDSNVNYALIKVKEGSVYKVKVGDYIGQNYGKITRITERRVDFDETQESETGDWASKPNYLAIDDALVK
jgi:type IV pilus assembly protein PilP